MARLLAWLALLSAAAVPASSAVIGVEVPRLPASPVAAVGAAAVAGAPLLSAPIAAPRLAAPSLVVPALLTPGVAAAAPVASAAPAPAAALPALAAASDAPEAAPDPAKPSAESAAAKAAENFDGGTAKPAVDATPAPAASADPGAGLRAADPDDEPWLTEAVAALARSREGRRVLRDIARMAARRGHPTLVVVKRISNNGEFRYDSELLVMDSLHRKRAPEESAPILAHELQHVLQRDRGLPADALELEIESYTVENRVWSELGIAPPRGSFAAQARRRLLEDSGKFVEWLQLQYKDNRLLHGGTTAAYVEWLEAEKARIEKRIVRAEREAAKARRVAEAMRAEGKDESLVTAHIREDVEPAERRARDGRQSRAWAENDLRLLSTPEGRKLFRAYSSGVMRRARALSRSAR